MRLLFLALDLKPEEDEAECIHVRELVFNFDAMGHDVMLLTSRASEWSPRPPRSRLSVKQLGGGSTLPELMRVLREAASFGPDIIYERRFLPKVAAAVSAMRDVPAIVEINGLVEDEMKMLGKTRNRLLPAPLRDYLIRTTFRQLDGLVTVTGGLAEEMARIYGVRQDRITVVENAANTDLFRPLDKAECRRQVGLPTEGRIVCFEGGLYPWHDLTTLLRAFRLMVERDPDVRLLIVGDGPRRAELEELARSLELGPRARFVGKVPYEKVPVYIGACDVGVGPLTPERNERIGVSPLKVYEYAACGRPVVVSRIRGVAEWVERENLGSTTEPGNPADLALRLTEALHDDALASDIAARGPAVVARDHSWAAVARRILSVCSATIAGG